MKYHNNIDALVWLDTSAEQSALYRQSFSLATLRVEQYLAAHPEIAPEKCCVFSDLDETLLDNSAFNSSLVFTGRNFEIPAWNTYCRSMQSHATNGAVDFVTWLTQTKKVQIFYVTSRSNETRVETAKNLDALHFPIGPELEHVDLDTTHLFMADMVNPDDAKVKWTKWLQYKWIAAKHGLTPILWLGDNLSDFTEPYKTQSWDKRLSLANDMSPTADGPKWGTEYIVMPNPVYGDWLKNYRSRADGTTLLVDDAGALSKQEIQVRDIVLPADAPKLSELEVWQHSAQI